MKLYLAQFAQKQFREVIVPRNKSKERKENDRLEMIRLTVEKDKLKHDFEMELKLANEKSKQELFRAEAERDRIAAEKDKIEREHKLEMELALEKEKSKQEVAKIRAEKELQAAKSGGCRIL